MKKRLLLLFIFLGTIYPACRTFPERSAAYLRLQGSDTMYLLAQHWAEVYMKQNPNISIYVSGGGTARGFQALLNGEADICTASRTILPHEVRLLAEQYRRLGVAHMVAKDALSIYIHPDNPVNNLTIDQLNKIFSGQISNWQEVGGPDHPITVFIRSPNSGTYSYFKEHVLKNKAYVPGAVTRFSNEAIAEAVLNDPWGIGYGGTAYGANVRHCSVEGVAPTIENVLSDRYLISRYLYLYTLDTPRGPVNDFIAWIMDKQGQVIVAQTGFVPIFAGVTGNSAR